LAAEEREEALALAAQARRENSQRNGTATKPPKKGGAPKPHIARTIDPYQPFPLDCLPPVVRGYVRQGADALGCDPAFVALPVLSVLASAIGNTRQIRLKRGWSETAIIWTGIVGDSGTLKSPAYFLGVGRLFAVQEQLLQQHKRACAAYQNELLDWKEGKKAHDKDGGADPGEKPEPPTLQRVIVSDTTIEKLAEILEDNPRGTLVARDELAGWIGSFTKYKGKQGGSDVPNWLEINRGGTLIVDRKTGDRKTLFVKCASASVTGGIQPGVLAKALTADLLDSGLAARLLLCWPPRQPKQWTEAEVAPDTEAAFHGLLATLLALDFDSDKDGKPCPRVLRLAPEAKALWVEWYDTWAQEQAAVEGETAAAYSKLEGYAARFALIYHCACHAITEANDNHSVETEAIQAGITLARWFAGEAQRIYSTLSETAEETDARRLLDFVCSRGGEITARDLWHSNHSRYPDSTSAKAALDALVAAELGEWTSRPAGPRGGRPTELFRLLTSKHQNIETPSDGEPEDIDDEQHNPHEDSETPKNRRGN